MLRSRRRHWLKSQRGAILPVLIILSVVGAAIVTTLLSRALTGSQTTGDLVRRKRAFYTVDGMARIAIREIQNYMMLNPDPTTTDLQNPSVVPLPQAPGYSLEEFNMRSSAAAFDGPVPSGTFEGMQAHQKPVSMSLTVRESTTSTAAEINLMVVLGQVSMFQFFVFGNGYTDIFPGPDMTVNPGRIHSNGDLCIGSDNRFQIQYLTSAGRLMASDSRCRRTAGTRAWVWNGTAYTAINSSTSNGCTNCGGTGMSWSTYAPATWGGHAKDSAHGVQPLRLPISSVPSMQAGQNAAGGLVNNANTTRLLIDPVMSGDSTDVRDQRYAWKADLRIINGVWYFNDGTWPGRPIWSDHPGSFTTTNEEGIEGTPRAVGQADLATSLSWSTRPHRYSYYEYDTATGRLSSDANGIVSYGTLASTASGYRPGFWGMGAAGHTYTDIDGRTKKDLCDACGGVRPCNAARALRAAETTFCQYQNGTSFDPLIDSQYLAATTGGFIDYRVRAASTAQGAILPMNLDVTALAAALRDTTPGELGSYFTGTRRFNGIVYVSGTWTGSMAGIPGGLATLWPAQGAVTDTTQAVPWSTAMVQRALPFPLCSNSLGYVPGSRRQGFSGPPSDNVATNGFEPEFTIPSCNASVSPTSRFNAVRVVNGASLDMTAFPSGLSIVSNLPIYVQGNYNSSSNTSSATATPWIPAMVGADAISLLSAGWLDANAPWDNSGNYSNRVATATTFNLQGLGGTVETTDSSHYSGGIENFPRFLENWSGRTATISGSFVVGFASVYQRQPWQGGNPIYDAPTRQWYFDTHLTTMGFQPPGAPLFSIYSMTYLDRTAVAGN